MKKKRNRLSFFQSSSSDDQNPDETRPMEEIEEPLASEAVPEVRATVESDRDGSNEASVPQKAPAVEAVEAVEAAEEPNANRMRGAFAAVAQVVGGEVEALRRSLGEVERTATRRAESEKEARTAAVDAVKRELVSRIDELTRAQEKSVGELKQSAERERERIDGQVDEVKQALEREVATKVEKLEVELDGLATNVAALQVELQRQIETSERVTVLLNNMAGVFSVPQPQGNQAQVAVPAVQAPATTPSESPQVPGASDPNEVEDALQRVFK